MYVKKEVRQEGHPVMVETHIFNDVTQADLNDIVDGVAAYGNFPYEIAIAGNLYRFEDARERNLWVAGFQMAHALLANH